MVCVGVTSAVIDAGDMSDRIAAGYLDDQGDFLGLTSITATINGGDGNDVARRRRPRRHHRRRRRQRRHRRLRRQRHAASAATATTCCGRTPAPTRWSAATASTPPPTASASRRGVLARRPRQRRRPTSPPENDLIGTDIENVEGAADDASQTVTITGDGRANRLTAFSGKGDHHRRRRRRRPRRRPAGRHDQLPRRLARHRDLQRRHRHRARRHARHDLAELRERADRRPRPAARSTITRRRSPGRRPAPARASRPTRRRCSRSTPTDDRGLAKVQFFDDDRAALRGHRRAVHCAYQPRGGDVGRNTLIAVAIDGAGPDRRARSARSPSAASPPKSMSAHAQAEPRPQGALRLQPQRQASRVPTPVSPSQGCSGTITLHRQARHEADLVQARLAHAHLRVQDDVLVQDARRPAACASRRSSAATRSSRAISSKTRTARLG